MSDDLSDNDIRVLFGARLRAARKAAGMSPAELAEAVGLQTPDAIYKIERGVQRKVDVLTLVLMSRALRCNVATLLPGLADLTPNGADAAAA